MNVVLFPVDRQLAFVQEVAFQLDRRNGALAEKFWRTECNRLYGRLQVQGFDDQQIRAEIDRFASAVQAELLQVPPSWAKYQRGEVEPIGGDAA